MGLTNQEQEELKAKQEREKDQERKLHNERTGGHPVKVGQTDQARKDSNERAGIANTEVLTED